MFMFSTDPNATIEREKFVNAADTQHTERRKRGWTGRVSTCARNESRAGDAAKISEVSRWLAPPSPKELDAADRRTCASAPQYPRATRLRKNLRNLVTSMAGRGAAEVDVRGREQADSGVVMLGVAPGEEHQAEAAGYLRSTQNPRGRRAAAD